MMETSIRQLQKRDLADPNLGSVHGPPRHWVRWRIASA
jgi:hypothetical protein